MAVAAFLAPFSTPAARAADADTAGAEPMEEIVVTATRREEPLSSVPISIASFSKEDMQARGVKNFRDLIRLTPGVNMLEDQVTGTTRISIRGIASTAGAATTGIYIDDTPVQAVRLGYAAGSALPGLFDVERVEILRGPQGTLFGSGSEGGTVRFITTAPDLRRSSMYAQGDYSTLEHGAPSYDAGVAMGGPLIDGTLGYRFSAYFEHDGGWIDLVDGTYSIVDPTGAAYGRSVDFTKTALLEADANWSQVITARGALTYAPNDHLKVTPAVFFGERHLNDGAGNYFDVSTSRMNAHDYSRQGYVKYAAGTQYPFTFTDAGGGVQTRPLTLNAMSAPGNAYGDDQFALWSVLTEWTVDPATVVSNTSWFHRDVKQWYDTTKDYAQFLMSEYFVEPDRVTSTGTYPPPGWKAMSRYDDGQDNFIEEIRAQSNASSSPLTWVAGVFYSHLSQDAGQTTNENFVMGSPWVGLVPTAVGAGLYATTGGPPFYEDCGAPGPCSAAQNFFGADMLPNAVSFVGRWTRVDQQIAGFAQGDYALDEHWKFTLGLRVAYNTLDYQATYTGPESNINSPFGGDPNGVGTACPDAPAPCAYGTGALAPDYPQTSERMSATASTPKVSLSYSPDDANLFYATASKGFRPPGASLRAPVFCDAGLIKLGYVDGSGNALQPTTYDSDYVWNYELGSKNRLFDGRLALDGSVYLIKWKDIQATVVLDCGSSFVDNLADATSKGFDLGFRLAATDGLALEGAVGYNDSTFDQDATSPSGTKVIYNAGSSVPNAGPPWKVSVSADYSKALDSGWLGHARLDYTYTSQWARFGVTDPGAASYDPRRKPTPAFSVVNLRLGVTVGSSDFTLFVDNLTNAAPDLYLYSDLAYDAQDWHDITLRARSIGLTATWRH
jgi:iron complex outermembrane recepter protein